MSPKEAQWFGDKSKELLNDSFSPVLNIGSSTEYYRTIICPQIDKFVFSPIRDMGITVYHVDIKNDDGVDITGDILDAAFRKKIKHLKPRAIFCNNLLEHVTDRAPVISALSEILEIGGYLFLSVPYKYPYHPDPIDTGYRVLPHELVEEFDDFTICYAELVNFGNYFQSIVRKPKLMARDAYMLLMGFARKEKWKVLFGNYAYIFNKYQVSCVILAKM